MKSSDWIQVIAICLTLIVSVISIVQSNRSIKLTEKTIEESNRPYVSAYVDIIDTTFFAKYLVLKILEIQWPLYLSLRLKVLKKTK